MQPEVKFKPAKPLGRTDQVFDIDCVSDASTRQAYIDSAIARNLPRVITRKKRPGKVAVVASGPSVGDCVDILKDWDGEIWGINRAFEWMLHRGIKPTGFLGIDPEWFLKECIPNIPEEATYYLAAQVHPGVFDYLKDRNVKLWFMADGQVKLPRDAHMIYGGSTCLGRAPNLAYALGYRDVHIFGGDSSYTHKQYVHGDDLPPNWVPAEINGRIFKTQRNLIQQASEMVEQMVEWSRGEDPMSVTLYGDGLMQAWYAEQCKSGCYEEYLRECAQPQLSRQQRRALKRRAA
jgi:hypothetical protein